MSKGSSATPYPFPQEFDFNSNLNQQNNSTTFLSSLGEIIYNFLYTIISYIIDVDSFVESCKDIKNNILLGIYWSIAGFIFLFFLIIIFKFLKKYRINYYKNKLLN